MLPVQPVSVAMGLNIHVVFQSLISNVGTYVLYELYSGIPSNAAFSR